MTEICRFCNKRPEPPWVYCQKEECGRASIAALVADACRIRREKELKKSKAEERTITRARIKTQVQEICPLCKELISDVLSSSCLNCKTTYHNDCLLELTNSRCSTVGCNRHVETGSAATAETVMMEGIVHS